MAGNTFGTLFRVTTWGESHGVATGVVIDGCPSNIPIKESDIQKEVNRRKPAPGLSKISTTRREEDKIQILSGIFEGKTTGTPISIMVLNKNIREEDYSDIKNTYRPGHADYTYQLKYGIRDHFGGGRASGRETLARVIAGAVAKKILSLKPKTEIFGHTVQVGDIKAERFDPDYISKNRNILEKDPLRCLDSSSSKKMMKLIEQIRFREGDSIGAVIEIIIKNPPKGLGEPVFDKLDADLAKAMMGIGAVKGVEIGAGFRVAEMKGSENNDQMRMTDGKRSFCSRKNKLVSYALLPAGQAGRLRSVREVKFLTNNCGGILGGISTGEDIVIRLAIKPVPSISKNLQTITTSGKNTLVKTLGRHDCCLAPRIIPVAESMAAIVITDHLLRQKSIELEQRSQ